VFAVRFAHVSPHAAGDFFLFSRSSEVPDVIAQKRQCYIPAAT
jgi:hypothetical protein